MFQNNDLFGIYTKSVADPGDTILAHGKRFKVKERRAYFYEVESDSADVTLVKIKDAIVIPDDDFDNADLYRMEDE